jgi:arylsulfatase A-like enzyme
LEHRRPPEIEGADLTDLGGNGNGKDRNAIYVQASGARRMTRPDQWLAGLRTERHKYVRGMFNDELPEELYDLEHDPDERRNVATEMPHIAAELRARLVEFMKDSEAPEPTEATAYTPEEQQQLEQRLRDLGYLE